MNVAKQMDEMIGIHKKHWQLANDLCEAVENNDLPQARKIVKEIQKETSHE